MNYLSRCFLAAFFLLISVEAKAMLPEEIDAFKESVQTLSESKFMPTQDTLENVFQANFAPCLESQEVDAALKCIQRIDDMLNYHPFTHSSFAPPFDKAGALALVPPQSRFKWVLFDEGGSTSTVIFYKVLTPFEALSATKVVAIMGLGYMKDGSNLLKGSRYALKDVEASAIDPQNLIGSLLEMSVDQSLVNSDWVFKNA